MSAPSDTSRRIGDADVTVGDGAHLTRRRVARGSLLALGLPWLDGARIVADFAVTVRRGDHGNWVEAVTAADPATMVAIVHSPDMTFAVDGHPSGDGRALCIFPAAPGTSDVRILALRDRAAVERCVDWFGGPPGFGAGEPVEADGDGMPPLEDPVIEVPIDVFPPPSMELPDIEPPPPVDLPEPEAPEAEAEAPDETGSRGPAPQPDTDVLAHVSAEMPARVRVGERVTVLFRIRRDALAPTPGAAADAASVRIDPASRLTVTLTARGYRVSSAVRRVTLGRREAQTCRFTLTAVDAGRGEVSLAVRRRDELPLATLRLTSTIAVDDDAPPERVAARAEARPPDPEIVRLPTLRIDESVAGGESTLTVVAQIGRSRARGTVSGIDKASVVAEVYDGIAAIRARMADEQGSPEERTTVALRELRRRGVDLSRRLLPPAVRTFLWTHRDDLDGLVIQTTGEFDVPWEVVYVSDPARPADADPLDAERFLGMRGATRWVYDTALPTVVHVSRARYLCPAYRDRGLALTFTRDEASLVKRTFGADAVSPGDARAMSKAVTTGFDLLHFGGHGVRTTDPPEQSLLLAAYRRDGDAPAGSSYTASDLRRDLPDRQMPDAGASAPMVFLNACDVGRIDTSAPGLGGFPEAFLRGGVGVLIGCSWAVDDRLAGAFVRDFYAALDQHDIAGAVTVARRKALAGADLTGLAYVAYAHPRATVVRT